MEEMMHRFIFSAVLCLLLAGTAQANEICANQNAGWVHWDATSKQNVICSKSRIHVYREQRKQNDEWVTTGRRYMCSEPSDSNTVRYIYDSYHDSQTPFYSDQAMQCLERKIHWLMGQGRR